MNDKFGKELHKGDLVAYGYRSGNSGGVCLAIITNPERDAIFSGGYAQGFGVHGDRLIRLGDEVELKACPYNAHLLEKYQALKEGAKKWL